MGKHSRDAAWFEAMYSRCAPQILAFARRRLVDGQDCEDVAVEVFTIAWRRRDDLPAEELPWLYATAGNVIAHTTRAQQRRTRLDAKIAGHSLFGDTAHDGDVDDLLDARSRLSEAFTQLSSADQEVLRLWAWEGLEGNDLGVALGCAPGAARTRLHRAKTRLRTAMTSQAPEGGVG